MGQLQREKPKYLAPKLRAVRKALKATQPEMVDLIGIDMHPGRISEYENSVREPNLLVLLRYARAARLRLESLVDDKLRLPSRFRTKRLKSKKQVSKKK